MNTFAVAARLDPAARRHAASGFRAQKVTHVLAGLQHVSMSTPPARNPSTGAGLLPRRSSSTPSVYAHDELRRHEPAERSGVRTCARRVQAEAERHGRAL